MQVKFLLIHARRALQLTGMILVTALALALSKSFTSTSLCDSSDKRWVLEWQDDFAGKSNLTHLWLFVVCKVLNRPDEGSLSGRVGLGYIQVDTG